MSAGDDYTPGYSHFSASLRVFGDMKEPSSISRTLDLQPTLTHRRGEVSRGHRRYDHDGWIYTVPVPEQEPLEMHILALRKALSGRESQLAALSANYNVSLFLGYRTEHDYSTIRLGIEAARALGALGVAIEISVIVT